MSNHYAIAAGNPATLNTAEEILSVGGNAVDAAIAAYLTSFVAEPCMASIGAGGFAMIYNNDKPIVIDFFCQTPLNRYKPSELDFYPVTIDFGTTTEDFHVGHGAAATPGAIAGIYKMHELYGSIPMRELAAPAITLAKTGARIDGFQAYDIELLEDIFKIGERGKAIFFNGDQRKKEGDLLVMHQFADFLETLAVEGQDLFYKGEIAQCISKDFSDRGGNLRYEDFVNYEINVSDPLAFALHDHHIMTTNSPSAGGAIIAAFLATFLKKMKRLPESLSKEHYEILLATFHDVNKVKDDSDKLSQYLKDQFSIDTELNNNLAKKSGTSHFNIVDKSGMAVALTTSIGEGCGYFIPDTDMQMNNMLGEAALLPSGFHSWSPNHRLRSMMTPTMAFDKHKKLKLVTGSGGAGRIPFAIAQVIINHIVFDQHIEKAVASPRIHLTDHELNIEQGYDVPSDTTGKIWADPSLYFGGVHSISANDGRYSCSGDPRRLGVSSVK